MSIRKTRMLNAQISNVKTINYYRRRMLGFARNVFVYENMPEEIDISYMNKTLTNQGSIAFFYDEILDQILCLPYNNLGTYDVYGRPTKIQVNGDNGYVRTLNKDEFVILYDNNERYPIYIDIMMLAQRIALKKRTQDVNIMQLRTPRIWKVNSDSKATVEAILNEVDSLSEKVVAYDSLDLDDITSILSVPPNISLEIEQLIEKDWNEFFQIVGISNLSINKQERMIRDEMISSLGGTIASRYNRFESRREAFNKINKKWGLDIKFKYYDGVPELVENLLNNEIDNPDNIEYNDEGVII